jgi:hypothetical protein
MTATLMDDLPYIVGEPDRPHVVLPYAFDTNDMQFHNTNRFARAADFLATFWTLLTGCIARESMRPK